jgi:hypothetical protein
MTDVIPTLFSCIRPATFDVAQRSYLACEAGPFFVAGREYTRPVRAFTFPFLWHRVTLVLGRSVSFVG